MNSAVSADDACMIYITVGSQAEAETIARTIVGEQLVACVNILGPMMSVYRWKGAVEEAPEFVLLAKTRRALIEVVTTRVKALHSYDTPCIVAYPMLEAFAPYLQWIKDETAGC